MATFFRRLLWCVVLLAVQILFLNRISLFGCATPCASIILILLLDTNVSPAQRMLWGFCMGLVSDIFTNTPGMQAASLSLVAFAEPAVLKLFISVDRRAHVNPGIVSMGWIPFLLYVLTGSLIFHTIKGLLNMHAGNDWWMFLVGVGLSTVMTTFLISLIELLFRRNQRRHFK